MGNVGEIQPERLILVNTMGKMADCMENNQTGMAMNLYKQAIILMKYIFGPACEDDLSNPYVTMINRIRAHQPGHSGEYAAVKSGIEELMLSTI